MIPLHGFEIGEGDDPLSAAASIYAANIHNNNNSNNRNNKNGSSPSTMNANESNQIDASSSNFMINNNYINQLDIIDADGKKDFAISQKDSLLFPTNYSDSASSISANTSKRNSTTSDFFNQSISPARHSLLAGISPSPPLPSASTISSGGNSIGSINNSHSNGNNVDQSNVEGSKVTLSNGEIMMILHGETILLKLPSVELITVAKNSLKGVLVVTNYRLYFSPDHDELMNAEWYVNDLDFFSIPLGMILKVSRPNGVLGRGRELSISCKDIHQFQLKFDDWVLAERTDRLIKNSAFPISISNKSEDGAEARHDENGVKWLFAFSHFSPQYRTSITHGKDLLMDEWQRQGLFDTTASSSVIGMSKNGIKGSTDSLVSASTGVNASPIRADSYDGDKMRKKQPNSKFRLDDGESITGNPKWRISFVNENFSFCETYPSHFVVPSVISDSDLYEVAEFRSKNRIPVLCWRHPRNGASIWRCSQPKVGIGFTSSQDERYVEAIRQQTPKGQMLIVDCRPYRNAVANRAKGMGYEDESRYRNTSLIFENIENIHIVRTSYRALIKYLLNEGASANNFYTGIEQTGWLNHIRSLISATLKLTSMVGIRGLGTIIHCSDGWDRAPQLVTLAQLLLDPYYRTLDGFRVLIEKEWVLFGHQFRERNGLGNDDFENEEYSPIFLQLLDCIWQFYNQFPTAFQFSDSLLLLLAKHQYSCRFGDFLCNSHYQRVKEKIDESTRSVWDYVYEHRSQFINPLYVKSEDDDILLPNRDHVLKQVILWNGYFLRESYSSFKGRRNQTTFKTVVLTSASKEIQHLMKSSLSKIDELEKRVKSLQATLIDRLNSNLLGNDTNNSISNNGDDVNSSRT